MRKAQLPQKTLITAVPNSNRKIDSSRLLQTKAWRTSLIVVLHPPSHCQTNIGNKTINRHNFGDTRFLVSLSTEIKFAVIHHDNTAVNTHYIVTGL